MSDSETLDPRVQLELEKMNGASEEINKLQNELDEARNRFRATLAASSQKLNELQKKNKNCIARSRSYYEAKSVAKKAQADAQKAAVAFRRSSSVYMAAKETIGLAEKRLEDKDVQFDEAWQEMLNHNTMKMLDSEKEKIKSELEHHRKSSSYMKAEQTVSQLERKQRRSISQSRLYYELKNELEIQLVQQKQNVDDLQAAIAAANQRYKEAMSALEAISENIHCQRRLSLVPALPNPGLREPGVGCEDVIDAAALESQIDEQLASLRKSEMKDDDFSSDADSVYSFDNPEGSKPASTRPDALSLLSENDSAIHSPNSGTLERGLTSLEHCKDRGSPHAPHCTLQHTLTTDGGRDTSTKRPLSRNVSGASLPDRFIKKKERRNSNVSAMSAESSSNKVGNNDEPAKCSDNSSSEDEKKVKVAEERKKRAESVGATAMKDLILDPAKLLEDFSDDV